MTGRAWGRGWANLAAAALLVLAASAPARAAGPVPAGFELETLLSGAQFPTALAFAPDGRLFFTEKDTGNVRIFSGGALVAQPLIHLADAAGNPYANVGLIGLVLDPDFETNGFLYIAYTQETGAPVEQDCPTAEESTQRNRLVRATVTGNTASDVTELLTWPSGQDRHGGELAFAPDGTLLLQTGDVECAVTVGDPPAPYAPLSQNLASLAGKMLRINPDGSIPEDNPFVGSVEHLEARPEIFAYGFRNGFGMEADPDALAPLRIFATENGPNANDEINLVAAGLNYGWGLHQGYAQRGGFADPIYVWNPPPPFRTVAPTGIVRYRGDLYPMMYRKNLFVGYANLQGALRTRTRVQRFVLSEDGSAVLSNEPFVDAELYETDPYPIVIDVQTGPDGMVYFSTPGAIYRVNVSIETLLATIVEDETSADVGEIVRRLRAKAKLAG